MPSRISSAIAHVESTSEKIRTVTKEQEALNKSITNYLKKVDNIRIKAEDNINKIDVLEKTCSYLKLIQEVEDISNCIEAGINEKNERKQVAYYLSLRNIGRALADTKCVHLLTFVNETVHYWHNILKERFTADYDEILKAVKWPFVGSHVLSIPTVEQMNRFQILTEYLLQIQLYPFIVISCCMSFNIPSSVDIFLLKTQG